jgi:hypothetical protein
MRDVKEDVNDVERLLTVDKREERHIFLKEKEYKIQS